MAIIPFHGQWYSDVIIYDERKKYFYMWARKNKPLLDDEVRNMNLAIVDQIRRSMQKTFGEVGSPTEPYSNSSAIGVNSAFKILSASLANGGSGDIADNGGVLNFDWFFPTYLIPKTWKLSGQDTPLRHQIQPVFFVDVGGGELKSVNTGENKNKFLAGLGVGLRMQFKLFSLRLDWAKVIGDQQTSGSGPSTFYFTFQSEI